MRALLLAAGLGTRLRPITDTMPKCLVPIHEVPLLYIWLERLFDAGVERVIVNLHHFPQQVRDAVHGSYFADRVDLVEEPQLLGTGGTIRHTRSLHGDGSLMVIHSDNLSLMDLGAFKAAHDGRPSDTVMTMALFDTDTPETCGIVVTDSAGRAIEMHEKLANPPGTLANAAVYIVEPDVVEHIATLPGPFIDMSTQVIPNLLGRIYTHKINGYHRDIGNLRALEQAHADVSEATIRAQVRRTLNGTAE